MVSVSSIRFFIPTTSAYFAAWLQQEFHERRPGLTWSIPTADDWSAWLTLQTPDVFWRDDANPEAGFKLVVTTMSQWVDEHGSRQVGENPVTAHTIMVIPVGADRIQVDWRFGQPALRPLAKELMIALLSAWPDASIRNLPEIGRDTQHPDALLMPSEKRPTRPQPRAKPLDDRQRHVVDSATKLRQDGLTWEQTSRRLGVPERTLRDWRRKAYVARDAR